MLGELLSMRASPQRFAAQRRRLHLVGKEATHTPAFVCILLHWTFSSFSLDLKHNGNERKLYISLQISMNVPAVHVLMEVSVMMTLTATLVHVPVATKEVFAKQVRSSNILKYLVLQV